MIKIKIKRAMGWMGVMGIMLLALPARGQLTVKVDEAGQAVGAVQLLAVTNNAIVTVWTNSTAARADGRVLVRTLQNCGTNAVMYLINSTNVSTTNYHGILAGGSAVRDGTGGKADFSKAAWPITLKTENGGSVVSTVEVTQ